MLDTVPVIFPVRALVSIGLLNTNLSPAALYVKVALAPFMVIPAPSAAAALAAESARTKFLSFKLTVAEFIVVVVPSTCKFPSIRTVPELES